MVRPAIFGVLLLLLQPLSASAETPENAPSEPAQRFVPPVEGAIAKLKIAFESRSAGCAFGEINMFDQESRQGPKSFRLLLALEEANTPPASPPTEAFQWVELSKFDLKKPFTVTLAVPIPKTETFYALSLCSDWANSESCSGKYPRPVASYFDGKEPQTKKVTIEQIPRQDELFSFSLLSLGPDGVRLWRSSERDEAVAAMQRVSMPNDKIAVLRGLMDSFRGATAPEVRDNELHVIFGFREHDRCSEE